ATHEWMGAKSRSLVRRADLAIVGGSNLLSSRMWFRPLWKLRPWDAALGAKTVLMGAGWYQFQPSPDAYTRWLYRRVLAPDALHSVRDGYSERRLREAGFANVVNTGCPTLWRLSPECCAAIPTQKGSRVVTTLNTYIKDPARDRELLSTLTRLYETVYFWPQTDSDAEYARSLGAPLEFVEPSLAAYDRLLASDAALDCVGLRLHGGIRALQHGRRAVIVEIDNRAAEMGADFALPTVKQGDWDALRHKIEQPFETRIRLAAAAITRWKSQFAASGQ
ncbi:MAG: polysaccharide pyruvyl transferase family protein, partial [Acidobacteria bacterium]|nr:polysaccharide pyruvyl transferase family protein [Acidobacteriota bacterium]